MKDRSCPVGCDWPDCSLFDADSLREEDFPQAVLFTVYMQPHNSPLSLSHSPAISFFSFINCASKTGPMVAVKVGPGLQIAARCIPGARSRGKAKRNGKDTHPERERVRDRGRIV